MIINQGDFEYRFRVVWILTAGHDGSYAFADGTETAREFKTRAGAEAYAQRLSGQGRGRQVLIQTGKLRWFNQQELEADLADD